MRDLVSRTWTRNGGKNPAGHAKERHKRERTAGETPSLEPHHTPRCALPSPGPRWIHDPIFTHPAEGAADRTIQALISQTALRIRYPKTWRLQHANAPYLERA